VDAADAVAVRAPERDEGGAWQLGGAEGGWWAIERAKFLEQQLGGLLPQVRLAVDIGCGRGEAVDLLARGGADHVVGCDFERYPQWVVRKGVSHVVCDANVLPFRPGVADLATAFDVVEHFADDRGPLAAAHDVVRSGGHVAVTVPAMPALWSPFDTKVGHHRRYTATDLEAAVRSSGLQPDSWTYFFTWLVPPAWLFRHRDRAEVDAQRPGIVGRVVALATAAICAVERWLLRRRRLPAGTSLWLLAHRGAPE